MLRNVDLDLAVKTGVLDKSTRDKIDYSVRECRDYDEGVAIHEEIKKLNEVIVQLSKELLDKTKIIADLRKSVSHLVAENNNLSDCINEYRGDRNILEKVVDKLEKRK